MRTSVDEMADGIYRISTFIPEVAAPAGFTFNQFVVDAEEPLLYHTGMRQLFPVVSEAVAGIVPLERLRWIAFSHIESDESGAMNEFLAAAPRAEVAHGVLGCELSLNDMADRLPRPLGDGEVPDIGGKAIRRRRVRHLDTPTCPTTGSRVRCSRRPQARVLRRSRRATGRRAGRHRGRRHRGRFDGGGGVRQMSCLTAATATMRTLAELSPQTLAIMHGSSYTGDGGAVLKALADAYEERVMPELSFAMDRGEATGPPPEKGGAAAVQQMSEEGSEPPPEVG